MCHRSAEPTEIKERFHHLTTSIAHSSHAAHGNRKNPARITIYKTNGGKILTVVIPQFQNRGD
jgi:hypothetical protein